MNKELRIGLALLLMLVPIAMSVFGSTSSNDGPKPSLPGHLKIQNSIIELTTRAGGRVDLDSCRATGTNGRLGVQCFVTGADVYAFESGVLNNGWTRASEPGVSYQKPGMSVLLSLNGGRVQVSMVVLAEKIRSL